MDTLELAAHTDRGPDQYSFAVTAGTALSGTDAFRDAELALIEAVEPAPDARILVVDGNYGVPGVVTAALTPHGRTTVTETSARCAGLIRENATRNGIDLDVRLVPAVRQVGGSFDLALYAPRAYDPLDVAAQRAAEAVAALEPGGTLLLAGPADTGVARIADQLSQFLAVSTDTVGGVPVHRIRRPERVVVPRWEQPQWIDTTVRGVDRHLLTRPGLFSPDALDTGSRLLIETILDEGLLEDGDRVLDLCAGYGAVGVSLAGHATVDLVATEDDCRATAAAEATFGANAVEGQLHTADGLTAVEGSFDLIATNPPTHAGRAVTEALFTGSLRQLASDGVLAVVYNETMGYADRLGAAGASVSVSRAAEGYRIAVARRSSKESTA